MKVIFIANFLILFLFLQNSFAEKIHICKVSTNLKKDLKCPLKLDIINIFDSKKSQRMEIIDIINKTINKEKNLPIEQVANFISDYRKGGALINIGKINPDLVKTTDENKVFLSNNFSSNRRVNFRGWTIKLISFNF
ncbi:MAG: hypothetical protein U0354_20240 [Candidatus Sericytochromatia bacterium]